MKTRKAISIVIILTFVATSFVAPVVVWATWTDDWVQQKVSSAPSYYEGQKRGYFQGGSFSARWRQSSDSPVTINSPSIKAGCGGIDMFTGGISFLDFEYLVQKLQRVLQSASGYAFQIGLKVLCEKCSSALEWITGISDALNGLQLDDCKAGKALVAYAAKDMPVDSKIKGELAAAVSDFQQSSGTETLWKRIQEGIKSSGGKAVNQKADLDSMISGCSADLQSVFFSEGSLLENAGTRMGMSSQHLALIRGVLGDIEIRRSGGAVQAIWLEPCEQNGTNPFDAVNDGKVYSRSAIDASCQLESDVNGSLKKQIGDMMSSIANKIKTKTTLTAEEAAFVDTNPMAIQLVLKTAVGTSQEDSVIGVMTDVTAKAYSYMLLMDLYARMNRIVGALDRYKETGSSGDSMNCNLEITHDVFQKSAEMPDKVRKLVEYTASEYKRASAELVMVYNLMEHYRNFDKLARTELQNRFGGAVTMRAMSR